MANAMAGDVRDWRALFGAGTGVGLSDGELLRRYAEGRGGPDCGEAAFGVLIERHGGMVLRVCRSVLDDRHAAEDAFQSTFLVLARRSRSLRTAETVGPWLHQVALRTARAARSAAMRRRRHEQAAATNRSQAFEDARDGLARDDARVIHEEIGLLPPRYRRVVVLCYLEGLTHPEAAERLRRPVGTVRSRLARGRDILRRRLERRGLAPSILATAAALPRIPPGLHDATLALAGKSSLPALAGRLSLGLWAGALGALIGAAALLPTPQPEVEIRTVLASTLVAPAPEPAGRLVKVHGRVSDLADKPVAGATVVVAFGAWADAKFLPGETEASLVAMSQDDGQYTLEGRFTPNPKRLGVPYVNVVAYKPGLAPTASLDRVGGGDVAFGLFRRGDTSTDEEVAIDRAGNIIVLDPVESRRRREKSLAEDVTVDLTLGVPEPYVGDVRDPEGRPLQGVTISIARMIGPVGRAESRRFLDPYASTVRGTPLEDVLIATSDDRGRFRFPAVPSPGMLTLNADAPGKGSIRENVYPRPGSEERPAVVGPMHPEARLEGRVVSTVPGVEVGNRPIRIFATGDIDESLTTDHEGRFRLVGLPKGRASVRVESPYARPEDPWTFEQANLNLVPGTTARPIIRIVKGGCVEGRVIDDVTGTPLAGVLLSIRQVVAEAAATVDSVVISNSDGRYTARLAPGTWNVYRSDGKPAFKNSIEVVEGKTITLDPLRARP